MIKSKLKAKNCNRKQLFGSLQHSVSANYIPSVAVARSHQPCFIVTLFLLLADQVFYRSSVYQQHFRLRSLVAFVWLSMYKVNYKVEVTCPNSLPIAFRLNFERCVPLRNSRKRTGNEVALVKTNYQIFTTSFRICKSTSIKHPNWRRTATFLRKQPYSRRPATSIRNQSNSRRTAASIRKQPNQRGRNTLEA